MKSRPSSTHLDRIKTLHHHRQYLTTESHSSWLDTTRMVRAFRSQLNLESPAVACRMPLVQTLVYEHAIADEDEEFLLQLQKCPTGRKYLKRREQTDNALEIIFTLLCLHRLRLLYHPWIVDRSISISGTRHPSVGRLVLLYR